MEVTLMIDGPREQALLLARNAYNASNASQPLTDWQFAQRLLDGSLDGLVQAYLVTSVSKLEFLDRFTVVERVAIREAAKTSPVVNDYLELLNAASEVNLASPRTVGGVQALAAAGLIGQGRAGEILAL